MHTDATSLPRLMQCAGSKSLPQFYPSESPEQSDDARLGVAIHWLASETLNGRITDLDEWVDRKSPNAVYLDIDAVDMVRWFVDGVRQEQGVAFAAVEKDMTAWNHDRSITIGCRPDYLTDTRSDYGRRIHVHDLKTGWRLVEVENNWTLIANACSYIADKVIDPDTTFQFTIWQPRPHHVDGKRRTWIVSAEHLFALRDYIFQTLAATSDTLQTGPYCVRCPARSNCPALRKASMGIMDVVERAIPDNLTMDDMSLLMDSLTAADHTLKQYRDALSERITDAIRNGQVVRNYRLVPYDGALDWVDGITADVLRLLTDKPVSKPTPLLTPTQLKKAIPPAALAALTYRKPGGNTLKRVDVDQAAARMFGQTGDGQ